MSDLCSSTNSRFAIVRLMMSRTGSYGIIGENLHVEYAGSLLNRHQCFTALLLRPEQPAHLFPDERRRRTAARRPSPLLSYPLNRLHLVRLSDMVFIPLLHGILP